MDATLITFNLTLGICTGQFHLFDFLYRASSVTLFMTLPQVAETKRTATPGFLSPANVSWPLVSTLLIIKLRISATK